MDGTSARAVLGLAPGACRYEVKRAYRALAKRTHPDAGGHREHFEQLTAAYELALRSVPRSPFLLPTTMPAASEVGPPRRRRPRSFADELRLAMA